MTPILLGKQPYLVLYQIGIHEIIGIKPRILALSLYKELITDQIWSKIDPL